MKHKFEHPAPSERSLNGPRYWRSLDELADTPGFQDYLKREFPEGASNLDGVDRRHFFKIMAASFALGGLGLAGCRRPEVNILPYSKSEDKIVPGLPLFFATAFPARGAAVPLLAETHQGRPTKLEGNPSYALNGGASTLQSQASLLDLYDPDRSRAAMQGSAEVSAAGINDLLNAIAAKYAGNAGVGLAFLAEESTSPTRARLVAALKAKLPSAVWAEYEPVSTRAPQEGASLAAGRPVRPLYQFGAAKRILSLDCDFMQAEAGATFYSREWAKGRRDAKNLSRLYVAESHFTITGSNAEHRLRVASSHVPALAAAIAAKVFAKTGKFGELSAALTKLSTGLEANTAWIDACVDDLVEGAATSLVCVGSHHAPAVHALALAINEALGSVGRTVDLLAVEANTASSIQQLATAIQGGSVQTLIILGGNPVYNAPAELGWEKLQKSVAQVVRFGAYEDETSAAANVHLNAAHYLESWGDARAVDGTIVPIQPMIAPLFNGLSELEVIARIAALADKVTEGYALVHKTATERRVTENGFRQFLHEGVLAGSAYAKVSASARGAAINPALAALPAAPALGKDKLEVRFTADVKVDDGRFANNGWLQECPEPLTKISWDNPIQISPRLAAELGLIDPARLGPDAAKVVSSAFSPARGRINQFDIGKEQAQILKLTIDGRTIEGPAHIQPGLANYTIVVPLGYGRNLPNSRIAKGVGFSAYSVRVSGAEAFATGGKLETTGKGYKLANSQEHWAIEGRDIFREANVEEHLANENWVAGIGMEAHSPPIYGHDGDKISLNDKIVATPRGESIYEHPNFVSQTGAKGEVPHQWGMSIDLNTCIGCNACVVACQAENNVPIVGKDQMLRGREMHWIRLDRYYSSGSQNNEFIPEDPQVAIQPMTCQHCESAPCENVCPVNATVHDEEGLNVMAYNRCIGTRYCANNCPYKVRRFNYFDWNDRQLDSLYMGPLGPKGMNEMLKMAKNPDVSVRMRGVMEKCTYCVQRIERAKIDQRVKAGASADIMVREGAVKTACQQVCPTEAIVFGNLLDEKSAVRAARQDKRTYAVLGYLNVRPRTTYLAKVRNPNAKMPDFTKLPLTRVEYENKNGPSHHGSAGHGADAHKSTGGSH